MGTRGNLADKLDGYANTKPDHPALIGGGRSLTYRDLTDEVRRTAAALTARGIGAGDIVGLCLRDTLDHVVLLYGIVRAGAVVLPMDVRWTAEERDRVASFFGAKLVLTESGETVSPGLEQAAVDEVWHDALKNADPGIAFPSDETLGAVLSLSSGTTGIPKGPMHSHKQMHARFEGQAVSLGFTGDDRFLNAVPIYFGAGRAFVMGMLYHGATVHMMPLPYEPPALVDAIAHDKTTVTLLVPTLLRRLLTIAPPDDPLMPAHLRLIFTTGAILHPEEREEMLQGVSPNIHNYYGSTEGGGLSILLPSDKDDAARSVGRVVHGVDAQVVDEGHEPLPAGEVGRVRYRGGACATSFYNNPEATKESFRGGWFYPGDLGRFDDEGRLYLVGRAKDMIIRGGVNIYPAEIEEVLLRHSTVEEAAVVAWPSREMGEEVAAFVVCDGGCSPESLRDYCRDHLARYKVPRQVFVIDALPKSGFGKVLKNELAKRLDPV